MLLSVCGLRKGEREEMQDAHSLHDHFDVAVNDVLVLHYFFVLKPQIWNEESKFETHYF